MKGKIKYLVVFLTLLLLVIGLNIYLQQKEEETLIQKNEYKVSFEEKLLAALPRNIKDDTAAQILTDNIKTSAIDAVNWIKKICLEMKIPVLKDIGLRESHIPEIVRQAKNSSSTKGNPVKLTEEELTQILRQAM